MLVSFPHTLRRYGLQADVRLLLELYQVMERGLVTNLGSLFEVGRHLIVKSRRDLGPYTLAFWDYFLGVEVEPNETVDEAIVRAPAFETWLSQKLETGALEAHLTQEQLADWFLNEVLESELNQNLLEELNARELLEKDNPDLKDSLRPPGPPPPMTNKMVDYSQVSLQELMERMRRVAAQQKMAHRGGNHWIGQHGASPYGNAGQGLNGIRVGGESYAGSARKVLGDPQFFPLDLDAALNDDMMDAALQALKHITEEHSETKLDVSRTVEGTGRNGGILVPYFLREVTERTEILLLLDNGGNSMRGYIHQVQKLFAKIKRRFSHDLKTFYFHNTIYDKVYSDAQRQTPVALKKLLEFSPERKVIIVGDAHMAPHELLSPYGAIEYREESQIPSLNNWQSLREHFYHIVWLNPISPAHWPHTLASVLQQVIPMEPLTLHGLQNAVRQMS